MTVGTPAENASLPELVRTLADDARELVRAEVGLAKDEVSKTAKSLLVVIAGATSVATTFVLSLGAFVAATVLALGGSPAAALFAAGGWGIFLVLLAVGVRGRFLTKKNDAAKTQVTPQPEPPATEPRLFTNQSEVLR
jgi:Putative Actinobacterial Holin-X, holin superfamily III